MGHALFMAKRSGAATLRGVRRLRAKRDAFLARASAVLSASLDLEPTLDAIASLFVPELADGCILDVIEIDGTIRRLVVRVADVADVELAERLKNLGPPNPKAELGIQHLIAEGRAQLTQTPSREDYTRVARSAEHLEILVGLRVRSGMIAPLKVRGRPVGLLWIWSKREDASLYDEADLAFVVEIGERAAHAIGHAQVHAAARDAIHARDEFLAVAGHELRTPLTALKAHLWSARRTGALDDRTDEKIVSALRQVDRLTELVDRLLDVARIDAGKLGLEVQDVDLGEVVRDVAERFEAHATRDGSPIQLHIEGPCVGRWDRLRLEQIVTNLVSNAVRHAAHRPIDVTVSRTSTGARLEVRDHGAGVAEADRARIFERFERATSLGHHGGLGLGLWIVQRIVDALGGTVRVESTPGQGATFVVELPHSTMRSTMSP
jgi:signal transduction histidine kinase